jgi:Zn-dependent protease
MELFRVRGIPVRLDFGWLLIFALISWSLASGYFPHALPSRTPAAYWVQGLLAALLLFTSVLLHELAHALVALAHGVPVGGITLHIFGGVSQLESEPETPRAELLIALVGPLTSFAIAGLAYGLEGLLAGPSWADALVGYLAAVNLVVGIFNLVPAFPLDGGRVLRAALWAWRGQPDWATRVASAVGAGFGLLMIVLGVARAMSGELLGGLWLALIGLFVHQAARSSSALLRVRARLERLRVDEVMSPPTTPPAGEHAVSPRDSAWQAFQSITRSGRGRVAVVEGGALVGVVTQRDLQHVLVGDGRGADVTRRAA